MDCKKWQLGNNMHACVQTYRSETKLHIRYFELDDESRWYPTKKGITLTWDEWENLSSIIAEINSEFRKQTGQRIESVAKRPSYLDLSNYVKYNNTAQPYFDYDASSNKKENEKKRKLDNADDSS